MKLIELIVKHVSRSVISPDAKWFMQDSRSRKIKFSTLSEKPELATNGAMWYRGSVNMSDCVLGEFEPATDAEETVLTREELMRAYDLVEQGYTLWFGGDCPVAEDDLISIFMRKNALLENVTTQFVDWSHDNDSDDIIAYRLSAEKAVPPAYPGSETPPVEALHNVTKGDVWPGGKDSDLMYWSASGRGWETVPRGAPTVTREQWDKYVSGLPLKVGDKAKTFSNATVKILFTTEKSALVRYEYGDEACLRLNSLKRLPQ